ncbi:MAG: adenine deaminase C-terminal domain-containing protein, partial [Chloroflexota bacterium]
LMAIVERHGRGGTRACAPLLGFELADGAVATTYSHDSHNLTTIGTSRAAMTQAANAVIDAGGGIAVVHNGQVTALLLLPVGGLMSDRPVSEVVAGAKAVRAALDAWGYRHANAFMSVSTLSLPVSPALKLTDQGLVDVDRRAWADAVASHA